MTTSIIDPNEPGPGYDPDRIMRYKVTTLRNRLFGLWLAERLGKSGQDAHDYAASIVQADYEEAGDGDVLGKAQHDLQAAGRPADERRLRAMLKQLERRAADKVRRTTGAAPPS